MRLLKFCVGLLGVGLISGCSDTFEEIKWVDGKGFETEITDQFYICRGQHEGKVLVGTYVPEENGICVVNYKRDVLELNDFEVLECAASGIWTPVLGNILPSNIYSFEEEGRAVHACRDAQNNPTIGVVKQHICPEQRDESCEEKLVCEILVFEKSVTKPLQLDKFTVFTTTNTMIETELIAESDLFDLVDPLQTRVLSFNIKARAEVTLFLLHKDTSILFEVLIGGLQNSIAAIRKGGYRMFSNTTHAMNILDDDSYVSFWVYWNTGVLAIGRADKYLEPRVVSIQPVITLKDSGVFGIRKYSVTSVSETSWNFWF